MDQFKKTNSKNLNKKVKKFKKTLKLKLQTIKCGRKKVKKKNKLSLPNQGC
jgi:hypothetical protein